MKPKKSKTFEDQLFHAMKSSGLLFPGSDQEINDFELNFGQTEVPLPTELTSSNSIIGLSDRKKNEPLFKMAAFSKKQKPGKEKLE